MNKTDQSPASGMRESDSFFSSWAIYQAVIKNNYMRHQEIVEALRHYSRDNVSILDLGCGDAYSVTQAFSQNKHVTYCGIDLSAAALKYAQINLKTLNWSSNLIEGDIAKALPELEVSFDTVIAGYCLHHLDEKAARSVFTEAKRLLGTDGKFLIYDLMPEEHESRELFIERFLKHCDSNWTELNAEQLKSIRQHVETEDFPLKQSELEEIAEVTGFNNTRIVYRDANKHYALLELST